MTVRTLIDICSGKRPITGNNIYVPSVLNPGQSISSIKQLVYGDNEYFVETIRQYIFHNYKKRITAKELADSLDLTYNYFLTKFRTSFDVSLNEYIYTIRLEQAEKLLAQTSTPITQVYMDAGFESDNTFLRHFKKKYQLTPREYRKKYSKWGMKFVRKD